MAERPEERPAERPENAEREAPLAESEEYAEGREAASLNDADAADAAEIVEAKRVIRRTVRERRAAMSPEQRDAAARGLAIQLGNLVTARGARSLSSYLPVRAEPDTRLFNAWAHEQGLRLLMPSTRSDGLLDWVDDSGEGFVTGAFGIPEPLGEHLSPLAVGEVDLMLVPACAVDEQGVRLGWGRGYFDRNLGSMDRRPPVFAIVHDDEVVPSLPKELHDVPVTGAVTPERILHFDR